jgi:hypothetical protein
MERPTSAPIDIGLDEVLSTGDLLAKHLAFAEPPDFRTVQQNAVISGSWRPILCLVAL